MSTQPTAAPVPPDWLNTICVVRPPYRAYVATREGWQRIHVLLTGERKRFWLEASGHRSEVRPTDLQRWSEAGQVWLIKDGHLATTDLPPAPTELRAAAARLHRSMGAMGIKDHAGFASGVLGEPVERLSRLTPAQMARISNVLADSRRRMYAL